MATTPLVVSLSGPERPGGISAQWCAQQVVDDRVGDTGRAEFVNLGRIESIDRIAGPQVEECLLVRKSGLGEGHDLIERQTLPALHRVDNGNGAPKLAASSAAGLWRVVAQPLNAATLNARSRVSMGFMGWLHGN
jgi:hypothetical protein